MHLRFTSFLILSFCLSILFAFSSCTKDKTDTTVISYTSEEYALLSESLDLPEEAVDYRNIELPNHLGSGGFVGSTVTKHGATLGRVLFFDKRLSANNTLSCAGCHDQKNGFSDTKALSTGFAGEETLRNSLAIGNVRFYYHDRGFFWDERATSVEQQVEQTVTNHREMGMELEDLPGKLEVVDFYPLLFKKAFGDENITVDRISNALSQYVRSMVSYESKFDKVLVDNNQNWVNLSQNIPGLSSAENRGRAIYNDNCSSCHGNVAFLGLPSANNGLQMAYSDNGKGERSGLATDMGIFKVPHLRNIELSGPYMHDGRFETLDDVIEHYSSGIVAHPNLHPILPAGGFDYTDQQKSDLKAFLQTFTDYSITQKEMYADPFLQ